jgi:hypothetical protein
MGEERGLVCVYGVECLWIEGFWGLGRSGYLFDKIFLIVSISLFVKYGVFKVFVCHYMVIYMCYSYSSLCVYVYYGVFE